MNVQEKALLIESAIRKITGDEVQYKDLLVKDPYRTLMEVMKELGLYEESEKVNELTERFKIEYLNDNFMLESLYDEAIMRMVEKLNEIADALSDTK